MDAMSEINASIISKVKTIRREHTRIGTLKLRYELAEEIKQCGRGFGRDKFFDLLRSNDLLIKRRRKFAVTTNSNHAFKKHGNELIKVNVTGPDQAWVADITYLRTRDKFLYLSLVTDVYSRKIVGWNLDRSLAVEGALSAVKMALKDCSNTKDLIHHSDRGVQYCCHAYNNLLHEKEVIMSMGEAGNCYDNAIAERVNGILKSEYLLDSEFASKKQANKAVEEAIDSYNCRRPHWSLNLQKPADVYRKKLRTKDCSLSNYRGLHSKSKTIVV